MREILFRGKRTNNETWCYGFYCHQTQDKKTTDYIFYSQDNELCAAEVVPETVGQYTGLTDVNDKKIFEGDIVYYDYEEERGVVEWDNDTARFIITFSTFTVDFDNVYGNELEVIGNIYDNPELLGGENNA